MEYNYLGRSNLKVSKICIGTTGFGPETDEAEAFRIMDHALELGINYFDTANIYGGTTGRAETYIGNWLAQGGGRRDKIVLATKVYGDMARTHFVVNEEEGLSNYKVRKHLEGSLRRLQTDHIDLYQVHHFDRRITIDEFFNIFENITRQGMISYLGTSNFPGWALAKFQMAARQRGFYGIASEQTQYNLMCRIPELEIIPAARDFGIAVLAYMPLAGGVLTGKTEFTLNSRLSVASREYGVDLKNSELLKQYSKLCQELGEKESTVAMAFVLNNPDITSAIIGPRRCEHLDDYEKIIALKLPDDFLAKLNNLFRITSGRPILIGKETPEAFAW